MSTLVCPSCSTVVPSDARFCLSCGTALARRCESCGAEAPAEARFCMSCGAALDGSSPAPPPAPDPALEPAQQPEEERRQVTVLFADLSGYTAVAERMDPESVKRLIDRTLGRLKLEVDRHGGTVDKFIGDNVMAVFGAPIAHEDDAERAVRAALGMQRAMGELNRDLETSQGVAFQLRVGLNTGEVLAGALGESYTVIGDAAGARAA
jgi:class 3 adenylate cyclase